MHQNPVGNRSQPNLGSYRLSVHSIQSVKPAQLIKFFEVEKWHLYRPYYGLLQVKVWMWEVVVEVGKMQLWQGLRRCALTGTLITFFEVEKWHLYRPYDGLLQGAVWMRAASVMWAVVVEVAKMQLRHH